MDEEEKRRGQNDPKVTPWGEQVERWVPFHLRDTPLLAVEAEAETEARRIGGAVAAAEKEEGIPAFFLIQPRHRRMRKFGGMLRWEWRLGAISTSKSQGKCKEAEENEGSE